jgi:hypothetical protein
MNNDTSNDIVVVEPEATEHLQGSRSQSTDDQTWQGLGDSLSLWHDPDHEPYVTVTVGGHRENHLLRGHWFRLWLQREYYERSGTMPRPQALSDYLLLLEGEATFRGDRRETHVRVARDEDSVYIDLGDDAWQAIKVTKSGWVITSDPPVAFVRPKGMRSLPMPVRGGTIRDLQSVINLKTDDDLKIFVTWMLAALRPAGPFPILCLNGEQGSAKTTAARVVRRLIDPNSAETRTSPREERDLMIAARNSWVISLDNLSNIGDRLSDALCRVATGGGFGARKLFKDTDETVFEAKRPIVINGIPQLASRPDLGDRCYGVVLPAIPTRERMPEATFWERFGEEAPRILGLLLDGVSQALRDEVEVREEAMRDNFELPRMTDAALWMEAAAPAFGWQRGSIVPVLLKNHADMQMQIVDADLVANAVVRLLESRDEWKGNSSDLLTALNSVTPADRQRMKEWPKSPSSLSQKVRRAAPGIRTLGIAVSERTLDGRTIWRFARSE